MLVATLFVADRPWSRFRGLLGRDSIDRDEGLLIEPCSSVHMLGMRFAIDAVFLDRTGRVLRVTEQLKPWRMAACKGSKRVLELPAGRAREVGLAVGDELVFAPAGEGQDSPEKV